MQPPTIPHKIDGYQVDRNFNKCLDCHRARATAATQAVAGERHALHRPRRQVPRPDLDAALLLHAVPCRQDDAQPLVGNRFEDVDEIVKRMATKGAAKAPAKK